MSEGFRFGGEFRRMFSFITMFILQTRTARFRPIPFVDTGIRTTVKAMLYESIYLLQHTTQFLSQNHIYHVTNSGHLFHFCLLEVCYVNKVSAE